MIPRALCPLCFNLLLKYFNYQFLRCDNCDCYILWDKQECKRSGYFWVFWSEWVSLYINRRIFQNIIISTNNFITRNTWFSYIWAIEVNNILSCLSSDFNEDVPATALSLSSGILDITFLINGLPHSIGLDFTLPVTVCVRIVYSKKW